MSDLVNIGYFVAGVLTTFFIQSYRAVVSDEAALITEHTRDLETFKDVAVSYWCTSAETFENDRVMASKVRSQMFYLTSLYPDISALCAHRSDDYKNLIFSLFRTATGGDFETDERSASPEKVEELGSLSSDLVSLLRRQRRDVVSLTRIFAVRG